MADAENVETWKSIPDFDDYEVSDLGRIRRVKNFKPGHRIREALAVRRAGRGYLLVGLSRNGKMHSFNVHRLVARVFIGECPPGKQVAHLDGNKTNNRLGNLAYVTPRENMDHQLIHGTRLRGERARSTLTEMQARVARRLPRSACGFYSDLIGVNYGPVWHVQEGNTWKHLGAARG